MSRHTRGLVVLFAILFASCSPDGLPTGSANVDDSGSSDVRSSEPEPFVVLASDGFEQPTLDPAWTVTQQFGSVTLTASPVHTGNGAVAFTSASGGQRVMQLARTLVAPTKGTFSIWFYDAAPGVEALYQHFVIRDSRTQANVMMGINDFDAFCYVTQVVDASGNATGPNRNCGIYPNQSTTNVSRTAGWHHFKIVVKGDKVRIFIDQQLVFVGSGNYRYDTIDISLSGPSGRPNTVAYFDDFLVVK